MHEAVLAGLRQEGLEGLEVVVRPALTCSPVEALEADGYVLGTPANIGYMSGALKHFFDQAFYVCMDATAGRPYALWVHGQNDTAGAVKSVESAASGMKWRRVANPICVVGEPSQDDLAALGDLAATVAANLL